MPAKLTSTYFPELFALSFLRSKPSMVTVNLTSRCNQRCIYCEIGTGSASQHGDRLGVEDLKWIIDEMAAGKIPKISLCGGEPFLFEGLTDVIEYAGKKKIRSSVTTNGMTVYSLSGEELSVIKRFGTGINISIDSFDQGIQSLTRGSGPALDNALKSIRRLNESGIPVTVLTAISMFNFRNLSGFFEEAYQLGIRQVLFQPIIYYSNYPGSPAVDNKSLLNVSPHDTGVLMNELDKILGFERTHKIRTNVYRIYPWIAAYLETAAKQDGTWFFDKVLGKFYCREVDAIIDISFDGGIQPCGLAEAAVFITGSRKDGLINLWMDATAALKDDLKNEKYPHICNGCCHHFSRNMLASMFKYPARNRNALAKILPLLLLRTFSQMKNGFRK
jgi:MoaA/NifB/PqqE/SkfB family radical SAM enzyme